jgi:hypothetical protein
MVERFLEQVRRIEPIVGRQQPHQASPAGRGHALSDIVLRYHPSVNTKHRKTLAALFIRPTSASIVFADIEALIKALGGSVLEREGSRVRIELNGEQWRCHRPHPGKEAKRYQVEEARELLERAGVQQ